MINRQLIEGQVEGAVVQAHGYAVTEDLQAVDGRIINPRLSGYLIPGIDDIPGGGAVGAGRGARSPRALGRAGDGRDAA